MTADRVWQQALYDAAEHAASIRGHKFDPARTWDAITNGHTERIDHADGDDDPCAGYTPRELDAMADEAADREAGWDQ